MFAAVDSCPVPVIARVQGAALGGGTGLACCCDIVLAREDARFGFTEVRLGLVPATISPVRLRAHRPLARRARCSSRASCSTRRTPCGSASPTRCSPTTQALDAAVERVLAAVLRGGPEAVRASKALIAGLRDGDPAPQAARAAELIAERRASPEGREGIAAFLERREPRLVTPPFACVASPVAARSRCASSAPAASSARRAWRWSPPTSAAASPSARPTPRSRSTSYLDAATLAVTAARRRRTGPPPRLRLPLRVARAGRGLPRRRPRVRRPSLAGARDARAQGRRARARRSARACRWCPAVRDPAEIGYPLLVKARAGGGGRGMRVVRERRSAGGGDRGRARARPGRRSATAGSLRALHRGRHGTSRCRSCAMRTAPASTSASATAPCSGVTRR